MSRFYLVFLLIISTSSYSQKILPEYPAGQDPYDGGLKALFEDIQQYLVSNKLQPCATSEIVWVTLKIDPNGTPAFIKKKSKEKSIENNSCAFELVTKALGSLNKWKAATQNGEPVTAYVDFPFFPEDFFGNFNAGYDSSNRYQKPEFPGGKTAFKAQLDKNLAGYLDWNSYKPAGRFVVHFTIEATGKMTHIEIEPKVPNSSILFDDIIYAFKKIKGTWQPALVNGKPVSYRVRQPLNFEVQK